MSKCLWLTTSLIENEVIFSKLPNLDRNITIHADITDINTEKSYLWDRISGNLFIT